MTVVLLFDFDRLVLFFWDEMPSILLRILKTAFIDNITNSCQCKKSCCE